MPRISLNSPYIRKWKKKFTEKANSILQREFDPSIKLVILTM